MQQLWEKGSDKCETALPTPRSVRKQGEEVLLQPLQKNMVEYAVPLQPLEDHIRADIHSAAHGEWHNGEGGLEGTEGIAAHGEPMLGLSFPEGHYSMEKNPDATVLEDYGKNPHWSSSRLYPWVCLLVTVIKTCPSSLFLPLLCWGRSVKEQLDVPQTAL